MYYYVIRDVWTGETLAEGTAAQLVESGKYVSAESVSNAYNGWRRRKERNGESRVEWVRTALFFQINGCRQESETTQSKKRRRRKRKRPARQDCIPVTGAEAGRPSRPEQHDRTRLLRQQSQKSRIHTPPKSWVKREPYRNTQRSGPSRRCRRRRRGGGTSPARCGGTCTSLNA